MVKRFLLTLILTFALSGCSMLTKKDKENISLWMLPVNITAGYFGAVSLHEGGHALTAIGTGGEDTTVTVIPGIDNGFFYFGRTTSYFTDQTPLEDTLFNVMGPTAMWVGHMSSRITLRSGITPRLMQPTIAWFGLCNQIGFYGHTLYGLARLGETDLGKEQLWISALMLGGGLTIDIIDILTDDFEAFIGSFIGKKFYGEEDEEQYGAFVSPVDGGGILGFWVRW